MIGKSIGPYQILAELGRGGMGEVYRARDARLNRDVAIKVLPEAFAADADRLARFTREAQTLAALNHPNIAHIHGLEESGGIRALVMEFVDGEDLSAVIARGPVSFTDALPIAAGIAEALEAAHEAGIIHRDLKPANVKVKADGTVKVLDFGLAKAMDPAGASSAAAMNSPTLTNRATEMGIILGTAAYMAPEQAKGRTVDKRADIWAFGVVLHEMLTGRRMFEGESVAETLGLIFAREPDLAALPPDTPDAIRTLLARCLVRDPRQRLRDIGDARIAIESAPTNTAPAVHRPAATGSAVRANWYWLAALAGAIAITAVVSRTFGLPAATASSSVTRLSVLLPQGHTLADPTIALSPDGLHLVYSGAAAGKVLLYHRALDSNESKPIAGTEGAAMPFFKPDSKWVGFMANGQLKKVALGGGALEVLTPAPAFRGGSWSDDGFIYFAPTNIASIWRVPETGGTATAFTTLDREQGEVSHRWPQALPDNQGLIFTIWTGPGAEEKLVAMQTASGERRTLVRGGDRGRYVSPGFLVYARSDSLMALPLDLSRPDPPDGVPVRLPAHVLGEATEGAAFDVSASGVLAMMPVSAERLSRRLVWVDHAGRTEPLPVPAQTYEQVRVSPDGKFAIVQLTEGVVSLWLYDFTRGTLTPFVKTDQSSQAAVWTADSRRVIYRATRKGIRNLYWMAADGTGVEERLTTHEGILHTPHSISPDGKWAIFSEVGSGPTGSDLSMVSLGGDRKVQPLLRTATNENDGVVSPGGTWLAFVADDAGRNQVYVTPFPGPGPRIPISRSGGDEPLWSHDGRQLFFLEGDNHMAVDVTMVPAFSASVPRRLYEGRFELSPNSTTSYGLAPDGKRFLRVQPVQPDQPPTRIDIVLNWREELKKQVK